MRLASLSVAVLTLVAAPAFTQSADAPAAAAKPVKEKKICRHEQVTGSILGGKSTCHTKEEWAQIDEANSRAADDMLSRGRPNASGR